MGSTFEGQSCVGGLEKKDEKVLGFRSLEYDTYGYLVDYLQGRDRRIFQANKISCQDFKLYFFRTLYSWSHVLNGGANLTFLDVVVLFYMRA